MPEGLFIAAPDIFKTFAGVKWNDALRAFLKLGMHVENEDNNNPYFFYRLAGPSPTKGILVANPTLVFESKKLPKPHGSRHSAQSGL